MRPRCRFVRSLLVVSPLLLTFAAFAQSDRGTITGTVSDAAGAVVPNAAVTAINSETGVQSRTVTTSTGNYTLASLPSGVYDISIEVTGFKKYIRTGVRVQVAETERADANLEVGSASA